MVRRASGGTRDGVDAAAVLDMTARLRSRVAPQVSAAGRQAARAFRGLALSGAAVPAYSGN